MSWNGYFRLGAAEFINAPRAYAYARALGLHAVRGVNDTPHLGALLGEDYDSPTVDVAPWVDPDIPQSYEFAGVIPLEISGLEDSTRTTEPFEFTNDGGNPGRIRHSTKSVVFNVALIGKSEAAVEHGFRWLKRALLAPNCPPVSTSNCRGQDLIYLRSEPIIATIPAVEIDDDIIDGGNAVSPDAHDLTGGEPLNEVLVDYERHLRNVLMTRGPQITAKRKLRSCNGHMWLVTFTATAGDPFEYGSPTPVLESFGDGTDPYVAGLSGTFGTTTYDEEPCPVAVYTPIFDPLCPALTPPPPPPDILTGCFEVDPGSWDRLFAEVPASLIPEWDEVRPLVTVRTDATEARMVRVRFYEDAGDPGTECGAVGEFLISYVPAFHTLVIDAVAQAVYAYSTDGVPRRADSLVYGDENAKPVTWFGLSCGEAYTVTLDRPTASPSPVEVDLEVVPRSA